MTLLLLLVLAILLHRPTVWLLSIGVFYILFGRYARRRLSAPVPKQVLPDQASAQPARRWVAGVLYGASRFFLRRVAVFPSHHVRVWILRRVGRMQIGERVVFCSGNSTDIRSPWNIRIGDGSVVGDDCKLDGRGGLVLGKNVDLSTGVWIWTEQHDVQSRSFATVRGGVDIGDRAWIGSRVIILPGVKIGEGAVVASGAVVTKDLDAFGIYAGVPAKRIGQRDAVDYEFSGHRPSII